MIQLLTQNCCCSSFKSWIYSISVVFSVFEHLLNIFQTISWDFKQIFRYPPHQPLFLYVQYETYLAKRGKHHREYSVTLIFLCKLPRHDNVVLFSDHRSQLRYYLLLLLPFQGLLHGSQDGGYGHSTGVGQGDPLGCDVAGPARSRCEVTGFLRPWGRFLGRQKEERQLREYMNTHIIKDNY